MLELLPLDAQVQSLDQALLSPLQIRKCPAAHHAPGPRVRYAQNHLPAALVGQRHAIFHQLFKVIAVLRLFELQMAVLGRGDPGVELVQCCHSNSLVVAFIRGCKSEPERTSRLRNLERPALYLLSESCAS